MNKISDDIINNLDSCLLGRLRLKLYSLISGEADTSPNGEDALRYIFNEYRKNNYTAHMVLGLLTLEPFHIVNFKTLLEPFDVRKLAIDLNNDPLEKTLFMEIQDCPSDLPPCIGVLVSRTSLKNGFFVYDIIIIDERQFPEMLLGVAMMETNRQLGEVLISAVSPDGKWIKYGFDNCLETFPLQIGLSVLQRLTTERNRILIHTKDSSTITNYTSGQRQKLDPVFDQLIRDAIEGRILCTRMEVSLTLVQPFDMNFCLDYPLDIIKMIATDIIDGIKHELLVYWDGKALVMNDDYCCYLAYRTLEFESVGVIVMGEVPADTGKTIQIGGAELFPPLLLIRREYDEPTLPLDRKLNERLTALRGNEPKSSLMGVFVSLARLIQDPATTERQIHEFILNCPSTFDVYGSGILSEVRLGKKYRIDLIIQYGFNDKRILLIELERATHQIFNRNGRPRAHVIHAVQQVEDWLRWWRENPDSIPREIDKSLPVEGVVVIGRSRHMDADSKKRLLHLNHNRLVKIITYDDLLDRIEDAYISIQKLQANGD